MARKNLIIAFLLFVLGSYASPESQGIVFQTYDSSVTLTGETAGSWRWMDVADQIYSTQFQSQYSYTDANVTIFYNSTGYHLTGHLSASGLKPHFAYQLKLVGTPYTATNERIGYGGRWWQEQWYSAGNYWFNGQNLNNKGDGSFPNPNDLTYDTNKVILDSSSPSGYKYKHLGYRVCGYFITDALGAAEFDFVVNNSYHVLWKDSQRAHTVNDGGLIQYTFDVDPAAEPAYSTDYTSRSVGVFGEWERLPVDGIDLLPGYYNCEFAITEESFHNFSTPLAGLWATAMLGTASFTIWSTIDPEIYLSYPSANYLPTVVRATSTLSFTIENKGGADLVLDNPSITFLGTDSGSFSVGDMPQNTIVPGGQTFFTVNYTPTAPGAHTVTMHINSNDADTPTYAVILSGTAVRAPDDNDWDDNLKEGVGCGLSSGPDAGLGFYAILGAITSLIYWMRRRAELLSFSRPLRRLLHR